MELLELRSAALAATLGGPACPGGFPELRATVWQSEASVQAAVQALTPQMAENKKRVRGGEDLGICEGILVVRVGGCAGAHAADGGEQGAGARPSVLFYLGGGGYLGISVLYRAAWAGSAQRWLASWTRCALLACKA